MKISRLNLPPFSLLPSPMPSSSRTTRQPPSPVVGLSSSKDDVIASSPQGVLKFFYQTIGRKQSWSSFTSSDSYSYYQPIPDSWLTGVMVEGGGRAGLAIAGLVLTGAALFCLYRIHQSNKPTPTGGREATATTSRSIPIGDQSRAKTIAQEEPLPDVEASDKSASPAAEPASPSGVSAPTPSSGMEEQAFEPAAESTTPEPTTKVAAEESSSTKVDEKARAHLEAKLTAIEVPKDDEIQALFEDVDRNGDGTLTMREVEKAIIQRKSQFDLKPTIVMRAFQKADSDNDGKISREEFFSFVKFITYYKNLHAVFSSMDKDGDRRLSKTEFMNAADVLCVDDPETVFVEMDENKGGYIVFDEFCIWMAEKRADENAF